MATHEESVSDARPAAQATIDAPVASAQRLASLDVLRGVAVMAIFAVNIKMMAAPFQYYTNLTLWPGEIDVLVGSIVAVLVEYKFITIFTVLYGAGLALIADKSRAAGGSARGRIVMRQFWLMVIGALHILLVWNGDILFSYAITGFFVLGFLKCSQQKLFRWAGVFIGVCFLIFAASMVLLAMVPEMEEQLRSEFWTISPEKVESIRQSLTGPLGDQIAYRFEEYTMFFFGFFLGSGFILRTLGLMLIGVALYRNGFLRGRWRPEAYRKAAIIGLAIGLTLEAARLTLVNLSGFDFITAQLLMLVNYVASLIMAFGIAALIMVWVVNGKAPAALAAVGQMALTNYLMQSLIGVGVALSFGLYADVALWVLMLLVGAVWALQLILSPLWLKTFRFGPVEWVWRSLTYGRLQPLMR